MVQFLTTLFLHTHPLYIYLIVLILLLFESSAIPVVNTTLLLFTGALAASGHINIGVLFVFALLGSVLGSCSAYVIGARGGRRFFIRIAELFHIDASRIRLVEQWFHTSGMWMVFTSRMLPYVRPFACFPAGISHMAFGKFLIASIMGSVIWCGVLLYIGWCLGNSWELAMYVIQAYTLPVLLLLALGVGLYIGCAYIIKRRLRARARALAEEQTAEQDQQILQV